MGYGPWRTALDERRPAIELQKAWRESCGGLVVLELCSRCVFDIAFGMAE